MITTDPIADLATRIRNGQKAGKDIIVVPASKMKIAIVHLLKDEGFVRAYKCIRDGKQGVIKIALKYPIDQRGRGSIVSIRRESVPSRRTYVGVSAIPLVKNGFGIAILSTSQGVMTCREARRRHLGGELLLSVY